ncbi:hypothetical protein SAMN05443144_13315 [Fodinibius roseus]|uniref:Uncharacterized protein n=1 Tax=Fodinibius roseus TaxID=1194090 RepID=A0A1M5KQ41_9BACT|nr:hypothetical protein [Fodinibius roseus]SHG54303.1 hypothetical protein SAMN05443144_13315 [Fodinibius roseus]
MAEDDFNFDEYLEDEETAETSKSNKSNNNESTTEVKKSSSKKKDKNLDKTTDDFLNRNSVESESCAFYMNPQDAEVIRAVAAISNKTQGQFMSYLIDGFINDKGKDKIKKALTKYRNKENLF